MKKVDYARLLSAVPGQLYELDLETGEFTFHNSWILDYLSIDCSEQTDPPQLNLLIANSIHPEDLQKVGEAMVSMLTLKDGEQGSLDFRLRDQNGSYKWVRRTHLVSERDSSGEVKKLVGIITDHSDSKEKERALKVSNKRLQDAERIAQIGHWRWDIRTGEIQWSDEVYRIFDVDKETHDPTYESFLKFLPQKDAQLIDEAVANSIKTGEPYMSTHKLVTSKGVKWVIERGEVYFDEKEPYEMVGTVQDITVSVRSERAVKAREKMYRSILNGLGEVIYRYDVMKGRFEYISPASKDVLGIESSELLENSSLIYEIVLPEFKEIVESHFGNISDPGGNSLIEYKIRTLDGQEKWILQSAFGQVAKQGPIQIIEGVLRDNTEKKEADQALISKELELEAIINNAPQYIFRVNRDFNIDFSNMAVDADLSVEVNDKGALQWVLPVDRESLDKKFKEVFEEGKIVSWEGWSFVNGEKNGYWRSRVAPIIGAGGKITQAVVISEEITEQWHVQNELRRSLEEKNTLLRELHHRVKNNLQIISGLIDLSIDENADAEVIKIMQESRSRIRTISLIHERLYRAETGSKVEFSDYLKDLVGSILATQTASDVHFHEDFSPLTVPLDQAIPLGLLSNEVLTNVFKHAWPDDGVSSKELSINLDSTDDVCRLKVSDNGIGFTKDDIAQNSVGWSLIEALVKQLKGEVTIRSNDPGSIVEVVFKVKINEG